MAGGSALPVYRGAVDRVKREQRCKVLSLIKQQKGEQ